MSDSSGRGYKHISRNAGGDFLCANGFHHVSPPVDKHRRIQFAMVVAGLGFLLPYNCFIFAVDFFQERYPNTTIMFDMSMVYIISAFFAVLLNNVFVEVLPLNTRITFGYAVALVTLIFVALFEIDLESFSQKTAYHVNLIALATVALGCTIQQSSYYGYTSMLPMRYTQAVMTGESAAGAWVSTSRIVSKLLCEDEKDGTVVFFGITIVTLIICWVLYILVRKTAFIEFYITLCQESRKKIILEPTEDAGLIDLEANDALRGQRGKFKIQIDKTASGSSTNFEDSARNQNSESQFSSLSFANPVYEPTSKGITGINESTLQVSGPTFKVEDVLIKNQSIGSTRGKTWTSIKSSLKARWLIAQQIYPYMVFIALAYFVSMCLYPGILSEIVSCRFGSWMPIILMTTFNIGDFLGKIFSPTVSEWARSKLAAWCSLRLLLLPLILMCCAPRGAPHAAAAGDMGPIVLSLLLGATGGALGAAPMLAAGQRVRNGAREMAGNIMTLSYNIGLTAGSLVAYLLEAMLGPQVVNPCGAVYPTIGSVTRAIFTTPANLTTAIEMTTTASMLFTTSKNTSFLSTSETTPFLYTDNNPTNTIYSTLANNVSSSVSSSSIFLYSIINHISSTASWSDE